MHSIKWRWKTSIKSSHSSRSLWVLKNFKCWDKIKIFFYQTNGRLLHSAYQTGVTCIKLYTSMRKLKPRVLSWTEFHPHSPKSCLLKTSLVWSIKSNHVINPPLSQLKDPWTIFILIFVVGGKHQKTFPSQILLILTWDWILFFLIRFIRLDQ